MEIIIDYLLRFSANLLVVTFIVLALYLRRKPSRTYAIALFVGAELIYIVIAVMVNQAIGLGVGFGIFAIFSLLRFRTVAISLRDMTYLFAVFTLSLANALLMNSENWEEMLAINGAVILTLIVLESGRILPNRSSLKLVYDNLSLLRPEKHSTLWSDVRARSGVAPIRIVVEEVNLPAQQATLKVYYYDQDSLDGVDTNNDDNDDD